MLGDHEWVTTTNLRTGPAEMNAAGGDRHFCGTPCTFPSIKIPAVKGRGMRIDERLMWLAGRYVGDGWSRLSKQRAELVIICGKHEADDLAKTLNAWPRKGARAAGDELAWHRRDLETACQFSTNHRGLVEWLRNEFGHGGAKKSFPSWAFGCDEKLRRALLNGYVSADGSNMTIKNVSVVETVTISRALAFSTKAIAESLGYTAQVCEPRQNSGVIQGRNVNSSPAYHCRWRLNPVRTQTVRDELHNWSRVQRVSDAIGKTKVFNISVEGDETYIADGIVVHNCKHFSKAKGSKPVEKKIRGLAWVALRWAAIRQPRIIMLENVEEFKTWGPVIKLADGTAYPCPKRKGKEFKSFVHQLEKKGYVVEYRELRACDYGAPTIRKRFFLIARRDGQPIVWPTPTHGKPESQDVKSGKLLPWRTAAECIDWSIPCPSIFERKRPLAEATLRRVAKGIMRYVVDAKTPFIAPVSNTVITTPFITEHANGSSQRNMAVNEPLRTQCAQVKGGHFALVVPTLVQTGYGERKGQSPRVPGLDKPLGTAVAGGAKHALVSAFLAKHYTGVVGSDLEHPLGTATTIDHHSLVTANLIHMGHGEQSTNGAKRWSHGIRDIETPLNTVTASGMPAGIVTSNLVKLRGDNIGQAVDAPLATITAGGMHHAEVRAFLVKHYADENATGVVTIDGDQYVIVDIGLRMLSPRELFLAQGFPADYVIGDDATQGLTLTKEAQVRMCGNSVCPPLAAALVSANCADMAIDKPVRRHKVTRTANHRNERLVAA